MITEDVQLFLAVQRGGSIKGGARALKLDHSTVSRRLASLEESMGAPLFERTPEGLLATGLARRILPLAERIEGLSREIMEIASAASESSAGPVRIATSPAVAECFLLSRMPELVRRFPDVSFDVVAGISRVKLWQREADIAIRQYPAGIPPAEPSALALRLGSFGFALYASPSYIERHGLPDLAQENLEGHLIIDTREWGPGNAWNEALSTPAKYALAVYPFAAVQAAAAAGVGMAVLPCLTADNEQRLRRLTDVIHDYDLWLVTGAAVSNNPRVCAVKDALIALLGAARLELSGRNRALHPDASTGTV